MRRLHPVLAEHRLRQHHPAAPGGALARRSRAGVEDPLAHPLERAWRWWSTANREHAGIGGHIASFASAATLYDVGFNHFCEGPGASAGRRPGLHPGPLHARHLRARLSRRPPERRRAQALPHGGARRKGLSVLSAPLADAGLLAVRHRQHGPGARSWRSTRRG